MECQNSVTFRQSRSTVVTSLIKGSFILRFYCGIKIRNYSWEKLCTSNKITNKRKTCLDLMAFSNVLSRSLHMTAPTLHIMKLTRMRVVDNSEIGMKAMAEGKPPKCIHIYNKKGIGTIGKLYNFHETYSFQAWLYLTKTLIFLKIYVKCWL